MTFIHSILTPDAAISADGDESIDLPVNPLSVILLHLSPLNETGAVANYSFLRGLLSALDDIRVSFRGVDILRCNGNDLAALALLYHNLPIWQSNVINTDNVRRSVVIPIPFGRRPYDPAECIPSTKKGELILTLTWDIADTAFDGLRRSIETIELPGAAPTTVQRITTISQTFAATGDNDIDLPIGAPLRGILCFGATNYNGALPTPTLGALEVQVNNRQVGYTSSDFEVLRAVMGLAGTKFPAELTHSHDPNFDVTSPDGTDLATTQTLANEIKADLNALVLVDQPEITPAFTSNYAMLHFDPLWNDAHVLETQGAGRVHVRVNAETANAARFLPIEKIPATQITGL